MLYIYNADIKLAGIDGNAAFKNGYIIADNKKIAHIGEGRPDTGKIFKDIETGEITEIDAGGMFLCPGFVDAHCHIGLWEDSTGFEGEDGNEMTDPVTPQLRAIDGIYHLDRAFVEARENGVTAVVTGPGSANVIGGQFAAIKTYGRSVDEMIIKAPAAMKVAFGENPKTVYNEKRQTPMTRMATAALLREYLEKALEYREKHEKYKIDAEENEKPDYDSKLDALMKVVTGELIVKAHAHRADDIITAIRIAKEYGLKISIEHCTEGYLIPDLLLMDNVPVVMGPLLTDRSKVELKNQSLEAPGILSRAGVRLAIMTDHPCVPIQNLFLSAAMAVREGMNEFDALKSITLNAAEITGISDRVGSLNIGKDADFAIFDGNPLDLKTKIRYTVINGKIVFKE